jgi:hypothetical protein
LKKIIIIAKVNNCTFSVVILTIIARDAQDAQTTLSSDTTPSTSTLIAKQ